MKMLLEARRSTFCLSRSLALTGPVDSKRSGAPPAKPIHVATINPISCVEVAIAAPFTRFHPSTRPEANARETLTAAEDVCLAGFANHWIRRQGRAPKRKFTIRTAPKPRLRRRNCGTLRFSCSPHSEFLQREFPAHASRRLRRIVRCLADCVCSPAGFSPLAGG